tara:strand:+ start:616 stop:1074 length:459 start_codon:yes stop_codon:yes gene_type:complete
MGSKVMKKCIIFDVDGTIADVEHRRHFVSGDQKDWKSFREHTQFDKRVDWVCDIAQRFIAQGDDVAFFSARNESERDITEKQIMDWIGEDHKGIFLRPDGDFRCDAEFKSDLADKFVEMGGKIDLIFDDRNKVVDMWRAKGFTVVQVADGDF